jgi:hypothetical protein
MHRRRTLRVGVSAVYSACVTQYMQCEAIYKHDGQHILITSGGLSNIERTPGAADCTLVIDNFKCFLLFRTEHYPMVSTFTTTLTE